MNRKGKLLTGAPLWHGDDTFLRMGIVNVMSAPWSQFNMTDSCPILIAKAHITSFLFDLIWPDSKSLHPGPGACFLPFTGRGLDIWINLKTCFNCGHVTFMTIMCPKPKLDKASFQLFTSDSFWLTFMCPKSRKAMIVMNLTDSFFLHVHDMITW